MSPTVSTSKGGVSYLISVLKEKASVITRACFWKIPHNNETTSDVRLKIGRYKKGVWGLEEPETDQPKSELTLDSEELNALVAFVAENYEPFKDGVKKYLPLDEKFDEKNIEHVKAIFDNPDKKKVLEFVAANNILPSDIIAGLQAQTRIRAIEEFRVMLTQDLVESDWQSWFTKNPWVLGTEFVGILDDRAIDTSNITDYLMQAYDGFLDIVEIKRPGGGLNFWAGSLDHGNYVPSTDLIKAITQSTTYIFEVEREANSIKFFEKTGAIRTVKPRCVLIFGRSDTWNDKQKEAYRILNASYHNLTILTYDHVLARAERILGITASLSENPPKSAF